MRLGDATGNGRFTFREREKKLKAENLKTGDPKPETLRPEFGRRESLRGKMVQSHGKNHFG
ncbi:MAG: hypothetical protein V1253_05665, partial [Alphaproteobacteria bacterium]|nr:hypothetical protein [Alphaproteobacteria bacterium]